MNNGETSTRTFFYTLQVIHAAFIVVLLLFLSVIFYLNASRPPAEFSFSDIGMWILIFLVLAGTALSYRVYRIRIQEAGKMEDFKSKLAAFQTALVIQWAILDATALTVIIAYSITGLSIYFFIALFIIAVLAWCRVTKQRLITDLRLNHIERMLIENSGIKANKKS